MHKKILKNLFPFVLLSVVLLSQQCNATDSLIVSTKVKGVFPEIAGNIHMAITGKGINVAHILPASTMLRRTGPAYGYGNDVYLDAQIFEFCSARISHLLSRADPENIVLCPFTISIYVLRKDPAHVRITYQKPVGKPGSEEIVKEIVALIESIISDATW